MLQNPWFNLTLIDCVCETQQTSDNEPHPGTVERGVSNVAGTVDTLIVKLYILHR